MQDLLFTSNCLIAVSLSLISSRSCSVIAASSSWDCIWLQSSPLWREGKKVKHCFLQHMRIFSLWLHWITSVLKLRRFLQNSTSLATSYRLTTAVTNENNNRDRPRRVKKLKSSTCIGQFVLGCDHYLSHYRTDLISGCFFFFFKFVF